ncbi:hypothetical protein SLEP1_g1740 [Rubroshorea leprosula]|uniref:Uncharacterized protein n=1 Tax=Rubroshorea leprosula TaxID=152421 RepID=A0AAV5HKP1_9ROSI|nr:hypothetical protein SLEP1_g1740 [Rubroshorea leprosula]
MLAVLRFPQLDFQPLLLLQTLGGKTQPLRFRPLNCF